ncbi:MAG: carbohydrate-binding domain-containing protein [Oscillospiraceae bacterium]|nr:carbohydrate-binding domain-containing protein [Oscillospiraceae bacterium]
MKHTTKKIRIAALLTALLLACPLTACGSDGESSSAQNPGGAAESSVSTDESTESDTESSGENSSAKDSSDDSSSDAGKSSGADKSSSKSDDSSKDGGTSDSKSAGERDGITPEDKSSSQGDSSSGSSSDSSSDSKSSEDKNSGGQSSGGTQSGSDNPEDSDLDKADEEKPTKYIYLNGSSAKFDGDGISVSGNKIYITKGGDYEISGTLDNGQIYIETEKKKVRLHLNNCSITNKAGSAIRCQQAKKVTIYSVAGTTNYISDGGTHDDDNGAIFSEDTVVFKGEGEINITGVYAHGVQSDDDIFVKGGTINISAAKSCLHSNDGIEIWDGRLYCDGGTNGIKTDGYITISGGYSTFIGGVREEKGSIYCDGPFTVTGGTFYAIGNSCAAPDASTTTANLIGVVFSSSQPANTQVEITSGGNSILSMTSNNNFRSVYYSGANLLNNAEYKVTADGKDCGSFTAGNTVTVYTVS